jgi:hypothetical protein
MANTLITPQIIAKEALFHLENNVIMGQNVHRQYKREFVKIGDSVTIRKPVKFIATDGAARVNQDVIEQTTSIVINNRKHVSWNFSTQDLTLTIEEYAERYIKPAMIVLANTIDRALCEVAVTGSPAFFNQSGAPGTTPADFGALADTAVKMDDEPVPDDGMRKLVLNPAARWAMADGLGGTGSGGIFNADIVHGMVRRGMLGQLANFDIYGDQNIVAHTVGTHSGTPLVDDAAFANDTNSIAFDAMVGTVVGALVAGDVLTIDGVFSVNDVSKQSTGVLQDFVVLADVNTTAGAGTVLVYPTLNDGSTTSTAAFQTVSALPADDAGINITGTAATAYPQNLAFHENALALVTIPLELPDSATFKARADWRGYSIRVIKDYDIDSDDEIIRLDILFGVKTIYAELGVRLWG